MRNVFIFIIALSIWGNTRAQSFTFQGTSPFGLEIYSAGDLHPTLKIYFADLDSDGDQDALHVGIADIDDVDNPTEKNIHWFLEKQINTGTKHAPAFGPRQAYTNSFPFPDGYFMLALGDLNQDNRLDMIVSSQINEEGNQQILYYKNTGTSLNPQYEITTGLEMDLNEFTAGSFFLPDLVDLDSDGDLDLLMSGYDRELEISPEDTLYAEVYTFKYAKNIGSTTLPRFLGWYTEPYNLKTHGIGEMFLSAGDIDLDGDKDVLGMSPGESSPLYFYENIPTQNGKPFYPFPWLSPFGLPTSGVENNLLLPTLIDIDGDEDLDLMVVRYDFSDENEDGYDIEYYQNELFSSTAEHSEENQIFIRPQPVKDILIIDNPLSTIIQDVEIMDISGKSIQYIENPNSFIQVSHLAPGTYLIIINTGDKKIGKYFLKAGGE